MISPGHEDDDLSFGSIVLFAVGLFASIWCLWQFGFYTVLSVQFDAFLDALKIVLLCVLAATVIVVASGTMARLLRPGRATAFVSYPNEQLDLATALTLSIKRRSTRINMIPFVARADHDAVLSEIHDGLRKSDLLIVIAIPGAPVADRSLRVFESEIMAAEALKRPVILLGSKEGFRLPKTAYSGYPILDIAPLSAQDYAPLWALVDMTVGTKRSIAPIMSESLFGAAIMAGLAVFMIGLVPVTVFKIVTVLAGSFMFLGLDAIWLYTFARTVMPAALIMLFIVAFGASFLSSFIGQLRLQASFRNDLSRREMTNAGLRRLLQRTGGGAAIIAAILDETGASPAGTMPQAIERDPASQRSPARDVRA